MRAGGVRCTTNSSLDVTSDPNAKGLAAGVGTDEEGLKCMRVYLANADGYVWEIGFGFGSSRHPVWNAWMAFKDGGDPADWHCLSYRW